jgi:hypothetical protein
VFGTLFGGCAELPVIPGQIEPAFHVIHLPENAEGVRRHFRSDYVYYAGSDQVVRAHSTTSMSATPLWS